MKNRHGATTFFFLLLACAVAFVTSGCLFDSAGTRSKPDAPARPAHLEALSAYTASLGTPIQGYGTGFPTSANDGRLQLVFRGNFERADGHKTPVDTAVDVRVRLANELAWDQFGPYHHPFTERGDEPGIFRGKVGARLLLPDNRQLEDPSPNTTVFTVEPSLVVREFTPMTALCQGPVNRAFGQLPYKLIVEAAGFVPRSVTYIVSAPDAGYGDTVLTHDSSSTTDAISIVPPAIPAGMHAYILVIQVRATDASNRLYTTGFAVGVHQPVEVVFHRQSQIAEIYTPEVASGCMHGGVTGRTVSYSESMVQTQKNGMTVNWNRGWVTSHTKTSSVSRDMTQGFSITTGQSATTEHEESSTNGWSTGNGFSITSDSGRSGRWGTQLTESLQGMQANSVTNGYEESDQFALNLSFSTLAGPKNRFQVGDGSNLPKGFWDFRLSFDLNFSWAKIWGHDETMSQEKALEVSESRHLSEGASANVSKGQSVNNSINGSETTTDVRSVTNSVSQTQSVSVTKMVSDDTAVTTVQNAGMGVGNLDSVSSTHVLSQSFSGDIIAGNYAVFYRQAMRILVQGSIVAYNQCGSGEIAGEIGGTTYTWGSDLAQGRSCESLPPSGLPAYQCLVKPCTGVP